MTASSPQTVLELHGGEYGIWAIFGPTELSVDPAATLTVTSDPDAPIAGPEPEAVSIVVTGGDDGRDFVVDVEGTLKPGPQLVQVVNAADQLLFVQAWQLAGQAILKPVAMLQDVDLDELQVVADTNAQSPGTKQWVIMDFAPGHVYLSCLIPDPLTTMEARGWYEVAAHIAPVEPS